MNKYMAAQCPYKWYAGTIPSTATGFINGFIEEETPAIHIFTVFDGNV